MKIRLWEKALFAAVCAGILGLVCWQLSNVVRKEPRPPAALTEPRP